MGGVGSGRRKGSGGGKVKRNYYTLGSGKMIKGKRSSINLKSLKAHGYSADIAKDIMKMKRTGKSPW